MMIDDMKKNELNEQEMDNVTGGSLFFEPKPDGSNMQRPSKEPEITVGEYLCQEIYDAVSEPVSTAWEVVKHAFEVYG